MIDKIHINTNQYSVAGINNPEWKTSKNFGNIAVSINMYGLALSFCPAKLYYGDNEKLITNKELPEIIRRVDNTLKSKSINVNINNMSLSRIDLAKNVKTDFSPSEYFPLYEFTRINYMTRRESYDNGLFWYNSSRSFTVYNKSNELLIQQNKKVDYNLLRFEYRLLNKNIIRQQTSVRLLQDLYSDASYSSLVDVFYDFAENSFLCQASNFNNLDSIGYLKKNKNVRGSIAKMFAARFCYEYLDSTELKKILLAAGYGKKHINEYSNEVKEIAMQLGDKPKQYEMMHNEIVEKLLDKSISNKAV